MGNAIEQSLAQPLGFVGELDLRGEMFAGLELSGQAADGEGDDEIGREGERVLELRDVQGEKRRDEKEIPGQRAQRRDEEDRPAIQKNPGEEHAEQEDERNGPVTDERSEQPAGHGEAGDTDDRQRYSSEQGGGDEGTHRRAPRERGLFDTARTGCFQHGAT